VYRCELMDAIESRGLRPSVSKLECAIASGRVPKPPVDGIGVRHYDHRHVEAFVDYLRHPPRPGRRPRRQTVNS